MSFSSSFLAARCSSVLTFTRYFSGATVARHRLRADLHEVGPALQHRPLVHPDDGRFELVSDSRRGGRGREHVAAADVDFIGQREGDRLAGDSVLQIPAVADDARDRDSAAPREAHARRRPREQRH